MKQIWQIFRADDNDKIDWHLILFFLNVFLLILGYSLRGAPFQLVKFLRIAVVFLSLGSLIFLRYRVNYWFSTRKNWVLWGFVLLNLYVLPFSLDFTGSTFRIVSWLPFILYLNYFVIYLFRRYDKSTARIKMLQILNLIYAYPLAIFFLLGNPLLNQNIYGDTIGGFKTNTLGWTGTIVFITSVDLLGNLKPTKLYRLLLVGAAIFATYTVYVSGSRSSYLCLALSLVILVFNSQQIKFFTKILTSVLIAGSVTYMLADPNSAVNKRIEKTEQQVEKGESRFEMAQIALETMQENPETLFTGFGFDNFREGIAYYKNVEMELRSHNSYLELLTTTGIFTFTFFFVFMVLNAAVKYVRYDIRKFIFVPPVFIIPFFESNLNAGQFLFFPWMLTMFFYVHYRSTQVSIRQIREQATTENREPAVFHDILP